METIKAFIKKENPKEGKIIKEKKKVPVKILKTKGILYLTCGKRNVIGTLTNIKGQPFYSASFGNLGYKGGKRKSFLALRHLIFKLGDVAKQYSLSPLSIYWRGIGDRYISILRTLRRVQKLKINKIFFVFRIPHNGCRPRKMRRKKQRGIYRRVKA